MQQEILVSFRLLIDYAHRLTNDIPKDNFASQPDSISNHSAWILGHLCYNFQAIGGELGVAPWLPDDWAATFGTGTTPSSDSSDYPSKASLVAMFGQSVQKIETAVEGLTAHQLSFPLPDEEYRKSLPTLGHALIHILIGHASVHVGQLTAWRASMRLPRVPEHFDRA